MSSVWESALLHRAVARLSGLSVVFCPLQSLKIHLMLPPYVINYHFCLTLFGSLCSGRSNTKSSALRVHFSLFFFLLCIICHGLLFFSHSFVVVGRSVGWSVCVGLQLILSHSLVLSLGLKSRSRQIVLAIVEFHIVHMHWYIEIYDMVNFFRIFAITRNRGITPSENVRGEGLRRWREKKQSYR